MSSSLPANETRIVFLDGIRGWASVVVLYSHLFSILAGKYSILHSKILIFVSDGNFAVHIFFVLSGMALSVNFFRSNNPKFIRVLFARRYLRLVIPVSASCLIAYGLLRLGLFYNIEAAGAMGGNEELSSYFAANVSIPQLLKFIFFDVFFNNVNVKAFNAVLWSMQKEFFGSLLVFSSCLLVVPLRASCLFLLSILVYAFVNDFYTPFFLGIFLAKYLDRTIAYSSKNVKLFRVISLALIFSCVTYTMLTKMPLFGFSQILRTSPRSSLFAFIFIFSVIINDQLRCLFSTRISTYLGRISFPLYLTHWLVVCSFSSFVYVQISHMNGAFVLFLIISSTSLLAFLVADRFCVVEKFAVKTSRKFANYIVDK